MQCLPQDVAGSPDSLVPSQDTHSAPPQAGPGSMGFGPGQGQTVFPDLGGAVDNSATLPQSRGLDIPPSPSLGLRRFVLHAGVGMWMTQRPSQFFQNRGAKKGWGWERGAEHAGVQRASTAHWEIQRGFTEVVLFAVGLKQ